MPDMLVKLYELPNNNELLQKLSEDGIEIRRAMTPDKFRIIPWVQEHSSLSAAGECDACFGNSPVSCFIATRGPMIIGYACYHATCMDFFGPTKVLETEQGKGIGKALLIRSLQAMWDEGYAYAIIGGVGPREFYAKVCGAIEIPGSDPGIYRDLLP